MKKLYIIIAGLLLSLTCFAEATIKVNAPNLVAVDEQFNLTFIIEGENAPSSFDWNPGSDFQLVWGPQKGTSTSVSIINGKRTKSSQTTYTYVLLPRGTGTFHLPSATATIKGESVSSTAVSIQVVGNNAQSSTRGGSSGSTGGSASSSSRQQAGTIDGEDLYMRLILSKGSAVVGESITATLKLYQRVNIAGFEDAKFPTFNGFWSQEMQAPSNIEFQRESIGDMIYNTAVLRSWSLIPQQAGEIRIEPAELVCLVNVRAPRTSSNSIFDSFFQDDYHTIKKRLTTDAVTVRVKPVPAGAPASFGGGVGSFKMNVELSRDSLSTHDAASLKVTISGKGNISLLEAPKINFPPDFELYDVKVADAPGRRSFEYPFIPRSYGDFVIDPVEYSYYDISAGKYVTLSGDPLPIKVMRGSDGDAASAAGQLVAAPSRKDVKDLGSDIRFISTKVPTLKPAGSFFVTSPLYWVLTLLVLLLAAIVYFVARKAAERKADVVGSRNRAAAKMARKRLAKAGEFLEKDLYSAFYEELHKALLGFVSDKFDMSGIDMSRDNIAAKLVSGGVPEGLANDFTGIIEACEFARYAPAEGQGAMRSHYESAVAAISEIDGIMKVKKKQNSKLVALLPLAMLMVAPLSASANSAYCDSLWHAGNEAYADGRWNDAAQSWQAIEATGEVSSELYYNLGNVAYKEGDIAHAVLGYMRALKLDPSNQDARFNLEHAGTQVQDRIGELPEFFLKTWMRRLCWIMSSDAWAILSLLLLVLSVAMVLMFLLASRTVLRKTGFFSGLAAALLFLLSLRLSFMQRSESICSDEAVVIAAVASVKSSPSGDGSTDLFVLHEGTCVKVKDSVGAWQNIELSDGRQGWIVSSNIERVFP